MDICPANSEGQWWKVCGGECGQTLKWLSGATIRPHLLNHLPRLHGISRGGTKEAMAIKTGVAMRGQSATAGVQSDKTRMKMRRTCTSIVPALRPLP